LQVTSFLDKYGINTVAVNQDTPRNKEYWKKHIHDGAINSSQLGTAQHLIVTAEQLFKSPEGHFTRLALLLRDHIFRRRLLHINIDEVHFVHYLGRDCFGLSAFRPSWGRFSELKITLPRTLIWNAFTATCPDHVKHTLESSFLGSEYSLVQQCTNRPSIIYARHCVVGNFDVLQNYLCFIRSPFPTNGSLQDQPRVLLFFDSNALALCVSRYLDKHIPEQFRATGFVRHYYSTMSPQYLQIAHDEFTWPDGSCRILCATSAESTGVDFPDVRITVNVGIVDESESDQRKGRGDRDERGGIHVTLFEPWVLNVKLEEFNDESLPFHNDPDRPRTVLKLGSNKRERVPHSGIAAILAPCIREYKANYFANCSPSRLDYLTFCCDGSAHTDNEFQLQDHLPGPIYVAAPE
ncbi:P-loop containing nucleoside triphosphate hydrolase protein, partial [Rhodocollybia butyracea]